MNIQTQVELSKHRLLPFQGDLHHRREVLREECIPVNQHLHAEADDGKIGAKTQGNICPLWLEGIKQNSLAMKLRGGGGCIFLA